MDGKEYRSDISKSRYLVVKSSILLSPCCGLCYDLWICGDEGYISASDSLDEYIIRMIFHLKRVLLISNTQ